MAHAAGRKQEAGIRMIAHRVSFQIVVNGMGKWERWPAISYISGAHRGWF